MKLDHINLTVSDVIKASTFLKKHLGYKDVFDDNNAGMAALSDGSGMHVLLMKGSRATYPKYFHIGFDMETEANVSAVYDRLKADGIETNPPEHTAWGSWTFNFKCPGSDFTIEVACASEEN
ncbi:MAG: VOC family protein [Trueperaceae bacterium]